MVSPSTRPYVMKDGGAEAYTLTCENGTVRDVVVARGETKTVDLSGC